MYEDPGNFPYKEMACSHCGKNEMTREFMIFLQTLRDELRISLPVSSGYRCPEHDKSIGGKGVHPSGKGSDILVFGENAHKLVKFALLNGARGVGIKQKGPHKKRFIHLDQIKSPHHPRPRIWTY